MSRLWDRINPTLRAFLVVALIALVVVVLQLYQTLIALGMLLRIAFFLAIAFFLFLVWRDRVRGEVELWSQRAKIVFYAAAALIVVDLGAFFWPGRTTSGPDALAFLLVLAVAGFSMWRIWRDERSYGM
jgi:peptidoglycan/LPS O-acetylase OafA/YrhL